MALQISYMDKRGVDNTQAYVVVNEIRLLPVRKICQFKAQIWHNSTARSKSDATQVKNPVYIIEYQISGSDFDTYLIDSVVKQNNKSVISQIYVWLKQHKDLVTRPNDDPIFDNHGRGIDWTTATDV